MLCSMSRSTRSSSLGRPRAEPVDPRLAEKTKNAIRGVYPSLTAFYHEAWKELQRQECEGFTPPKNMESVGSAFAKFFSCTRQLPPPYWRVLKDLVEIDRYEHCSQPARSEATDGLIPQLPQLEQAGLLPILNVKPLFRQPTEDPRTCFRLTQRELSSIPDLLGYDIVLETLKTRSRALVWGPAGTGKTTLATVLALRFPDLGPAYYMDLACPPSELDWRLGTKILSAIRGSPSEPPFLIFDNVDVAPEFAECFLHNWELLERKPRALMLGKPQADGAACSSLKAMFPKVVRIEVPETELLSILRMFIGRVWPDAKGLEPATSEFLKCFQQHFREDLFSFLLVVSVSLELIQINQWELSPSSRRDEVRRHFLTPLSASQQKSLWLAALLAKFDCPIPNYFFNGDDAGVLLQRGLLDSAGVIEGQQFFGFAHPSLESYLFASVEPDFSAAAAKHLVSERPRLAVSLLFALDPSQDSIKADLISRLLSAPDPLLWHTYAAQLDGGTIRRFLNEAVRLNLIHDCSLDDELNAYALPKLLSYMHVKAGIETEAFPELHSLYARLEKAAKVSKEPRRMPADTMKGLFPKQWDKL